MKGDLFGVTRLFRKFKIKSVISCAKETLINSMFNAPIVLF